MENQAVESKGLVGPVWQVRAVDTSGAGDAFLGTLAAQLARGVRAHYTELLKTPEDASLEMSLSFAHMTAWGCPITRCMGHNGVCLVHAMLGLVVQR